MPARLPSSAAFPSSLSQCIPAARSQATHQWHARNFSQTCRAEQTALRREMYNWLNGPGAQLRHPLPGSTNYLGAYNKSGVLIRAAAAAPKADEGKGDGSRTGTAAKAAEPDDGGLEERLEVPDSREAARTRVDEDDNRLPPESREDLAPFPLNKHFYSQAVLSEELRERIYEAVVREEMSVGIVSASYKVSTERVAAVVRLKALEKQWETQEKPMAKPYAKAVLGMLPTTRLATDLKFQPAHESIADLRVHPATRQQIFYPTSESRRFTRADAAHVFAPGLLPADQRIPHPDLVEAERDQFLGLDFEERVRRQQERNARHKRDAEWKEQRAAEQRARTHNVRGRRWDFKFQDFSVEQVGRDGKSPGGVGWRYGRPHEDRKRGQVKIPRKVDA